MTNCAYNWASCVEEVKAAVKVSSTNKLLIKWRQWRSRWWILRHNIRLHTSPRKTNLEFLSLKDREKSQDRWHIFCFHKAINEERKILRGPCVIIILVNKAIRSITRLTHITWRSLSPRRLMQLSMCGSCEGMNGDNLGRCYFAQITASRDENFIHGIDRTRNVLCHKTDRENN